MTGFARNDLRLVTAVLVLSLFAMCGCSGSHDIVGKWRTGGDANAILWEFSPNGAVLIGSTRGRYSFGDQNRVKIEMPAATSTYQMEFAGDKMILRAPSGLKLEFKKVAESTR
jgi:hypothetical protein